MTWGESKLFFFCFRGPLGTSHPLHIYGSVSFSQKHVYRIEYDDFATRRVFVVFQKSCKHAYTNRPRDAHVFPARIAR